MYIYTVLLRGNVGHGVDVRGSPRLQKLAGQGRRHAYKGIISYKYKL